MRGGDGCGLQVLIPPKMSEIPGSLLASGTRSERLRKSIWAISMDGEVAASVSIAPVAIDHHGKGKSYGSVDEPSAHRGG